MSRIAKDTRMKVIKMRIDFGDAILTHLGLTVEEIMKRKIGPI